MVISRAGNTHHSAIQEVLSASGRVMSHRVSELPSLGYRERFNQPPSPIVNPLRVTLHLGATPSDKSVPAPRRLATRYARSFTDDLSAATAAERRASVGGRRVRFELPTKSPSLVGGATVLGNGSAIKQAHHVAGVDSWLRSRAGSSDTSTTTTTTSSSSTSSSTPSPSSSSNTHTTRSTASRVHDTRRYRNGTLPPTSSTSPPEAAVATASSVAVLKAARDTDERALIEYLQMVGPAGISEDEINAVDGGGKTAISYIASHGSLPMLEAILQVPGVDVNKPDNEGNTPLHFAAQAGHADVVNYILSRCTGVRVDARNNLGFTPLMKAALQGRTRCAKLLIVAGASPTLKDTGKGLRPEEWARYCGRYVCADMIVKVSRHHLLERSTSYGRWGSEPELGNKLLDGKLLPNSQPNHSPAGFTSRIKQAFWNKSHSGITGDTAKQRYSSLVTQLTTAALCASSPVLPARGTSKDPGVKSLIRPLAVPKLHVTPVAASTITTTTTSTTILPPTTAEGGGKERQGATRSSPRQIFLKKKK